MRVGHADGGADSAEDTEGVSIGPVVAEEGLEIGCRHFLG